MSRKIVFTDEQIQQVEALGSYLSIEQVADYFGIHKDTFYELIKRQPEILRRYKKGKSKIVASIAKSLISQARAGNIAAQCFYLKTQAGWKEDKTITVEDKQQSKKMVIKFDISK